MPRTLSEDLVRHVEPLRVDQDLRTAVKRVIDSGLPALPVVGADDVLVGIFGEREFIGAIFPGYLGELGYAGFVTQAAEKTIAKRDSCLADPVEKYMNTEHVDVGSDYSDAQLAEVFLHHRVLIVPVADDGKLAGVITRSDFFRAVAGTQSA